LAQFFGGTVYSRADDHPRICYTALSGMIFAMFLLEFCGEVNHEETRVMLLVYFFVYD